MQFKIGQRVRVINANREKHLIGREAEVVGRLERVRDYITGEIYTGYEISVDGVGARTTDGYARLVAPPEYLVPLTDPKADAFMERVKKWEPLRESEEVLAAMGATHIEVFPL